MGGRGSAGGAGVGRNANSPEYKSAYNIEMENARSFEASFAIENGTTKDAIGYHIFYGHVPEECDWNVVRVAPHYDEIVKRRKAHEVSVSAGTP